LLCFCKCILSYNSLCTAQCIMDSLWFSSLFWLACCHIMAIGMGWCCTAATCMTSLTTFTQVNSDHEKHLGSNKQYRPQSLSTKGKKFVTVFRSRSLLTIFCFVDYLLCSGAWCRPHVEHYCVDRVHPDKL
jgi:hypothetical protein